MRIWKKKLFRFKNEVYKKKEKINK